MNRDLLLGVAASVLLHSGAFFSDRFLNFRTKVRVAPPVEDKAISIVMPHFEPDDPARKEAPEEEARLSFVPPQQIDIPQPVLAGGFEQVVQLPPPDYTKLPTGIGDFDRSSLGRTANQNIFEPGLLDQVPTARYQIPPVYPFDMRRTGTAGEVLVDFLVDTDGTVLNARAVRSTQREFEPNAIQAVAKWKFRPGRKDGQNVVTHMQVPIVFSLDQK